MKIVKYIKNWGLSILAASCLLSSCDYLDVVPPEQPNLSDATKSYERALGFLYSCYTGIKATSAGNDAIDPSNTWNYGSAIMGSTDDYVLPQLWTDAGYWDDYGWNLVSANNQQWIWGRAYQYVGQCLLFLQELEDMDPSLVSADELKIWKAEAKFLIAYYHFVCLRSYGPIPITDSYIDMDTPASDYVGRYHFDYCVDWIVEQLDEAAADLPAYREKADEWGRVTSVIAKAIKARMLLYAASPLWNGSFPYPAWKNTNFETPGYGKDLVSSSYDATKWDRALTACKEALALAEGAGKHELYDIDDYYSIQQLSLPYVPGLSDLSYEADKDAEAIAERDAFLKTIMKMRYLVTTRVDEGNKEIIWGNWNTSIYYIQSSSIPHHVLKNSSGTWLNGWSGVAPTLNVVENFYTKNGLPITMDEEFYPESEWFEAGPYTRSHKNANNENVTLKVAKLHMNREPRFYAWIGFDGGDYTSKIYAGSPLKLEMRNANIHGYDAEAFNRDNSATGYLSQKFLHPTYEISTSASSVSSGSAYPSIQIRLAELYLNLAECYAAKGDVANTLKYLNPIRSRAGIPELTTANISDEMTLTEWVRRERSIELWAEGHRFFDVRRWVEGPRYFGAGVRKGLNALVKNPTWEEFYQPTVLPHGYVWTNRMYLNPLYYNEVYKNPQMVQAPEY